MGADTGGYPVTQPRETALSQFSPLALAREILERPEGYDVRLVEWAKQVVRECAQK
jgi:hypothetical protein